jgi:hypothetical protein
VPRPALILALALAGAIHCRAGRERPAERAPAAPAPPEPEHPAAVLCAEPARLANASRASAVWMIRAPSTSPGAEPSGLIGHYYTSGGLHIVILDTLGTDGCWRTADSVATPVASATEFVTNACGLAPDSSDRRWVAVLSDTTAQVPRVAWRLQDDPPRIVPASVDSVTCWRKFAG